MKTIGIIGSGAVAKKLAIGLTNHGYVVMLSSRDQSKRDELKRETGALAGSFEEAAVFGEIVIYAVKGTVAEELIASLSGRLPWFFAACRSWRCCSF